MSRPLPDRGGSDSASNSREYPSHRDSDRGRRSSYYDYEHPREASPDRYHNRPPSKGRSLSRSSSGTRYDRPSPDFEASYHGHRDRRTRSPIFDDRRYERSRNRKSREPYDYDKPRSPTRRDSSRDWGRRESFDAPRYRESSYEDNDRRRYSEHSTERKRRVNDRERSPLRFNDAVETMRAARKTADSLNEISYFNAHTLPIPTRGSLPQRSAKLDSISPDKPPTTTRSNNHADVLPSTYSRDSLRLHSSPPRRVSSPKSNSSGNAPFPDEPLSPTYLDYPREKRPSLPRSHSDAKRMIPSHAPAKSRSLKTYDDEDLAPIYSEYPYEIPLDNPYIKHFPHTPGLDDSPYKRRESPRRRSPDVYPLHDDHPKHAHPSYLSPMAKQSRSQPTVGQPALFGGGVFNSRVTQATNNVSNSNSGSLFGHERVEFSFRPPSSPEDVEMLDLSDTAPSNCNTVTPGMPTPQPAPTNPLSGLFNKPDSSTTFLQSLNLPPSQTSAPVNHQPMLSQHPSSGRSHPLPPNDRRFDTAHHAPPPQYVQPPPIYHSFKNSDDFEPVQNYGSFAPPCQQQFSPYGSRRETPGFSPQAPAYDDEPGNDGANSPEVPAYDDEEEPKSPVPPDYDYDGNDSPQPGEEISYDTPLMASIAHEVDPTLPKPVDVRFGADIMAQFEESLDNVFEEPSIPSSSPPDENTPKLTPPGCPVPKESAPLKTNPPNPKKNGPTISKEPQLPTYRRQFSSSSSYESTVSSVSTNSSVVGKEYLVDCLRYVDTIEDVLLDLSLVDAEPERVYAGSIVHVSFDILLSVNKNNTFFGELLGQSDIFGIAIGCEPRYAPIFKKKMVYGDGNTIQSYLERMTKWIFAVRMEHHLVAIGPCGFDDGCDTEEGRRTQREVFKMQADMAAKFDVPLIVTTRGRKAFLQIAKELKEAIGTKHEIYYTDFNGSLSDAQRLLKEFPKMRFGIQHANINMFNIRDIITDLPLKALLIESGKLKSNSINNAYVVAERIARYKQVPLNEVLKTMILNAKEFYHLQI